MKTDEITAAIAAARRFVKTKEQLAAVDRLASQAKQAANDLPGDLSQKIQEPLRQCLKIIEDAVSATLKEELDFEFGLLKSLKEEN